MKIATGNRLNEFWEELMGVLVPKSKVLKTLEEVDANTNEENIAGATALKEVNNNLMFPDGTKFYPDIKDGVHGFNTDPQRGADTFCPFSKVWYGNIKANGSFNNIGFKPKYLMGVSVTSTQSRMTGWAWCADSPNTLYWGYYTLAASARTASTYLKIYADGFAYTDSNDTGATMRILAVG